MLASVAVPVFVEHCRLSELCTNVHLNRLFESDIPPFCDEGGLIFH